MPRVHQEILDDACATPTKHVRIQTFPVRRRTARPKSEALAAQTASQEAAAATAALSCTDNDTGAPKQPPPLVSSPVAAPEAAAETASSSAAGAAANSSSTAATKRVSRRTFPSRRRDAQSMSCEGDAATSPQAQPRAQSPTQSALPQELPTHAGADDEPLLCPTPTKHVHVRTFPSRRRVPRTKSDKRQAGDPNSTDDDDDDAASTSSSSSRHRQPASERRKVVLFDDSVVLPAAGALPPPSPARTPTSFFTRACQQPRRSAITLIDEARIPFLKVGDGQNESLIEFLSRDTGVSNRHLTWQKLLEAALSLRQLHDQGIVHGRLQCRNILITADEQARVRNFGAHFRANHLQGKASLYVENSPASTVSSLWDEEELETVRWRAPECLVDGWEDCSERSGVSKEADVFSFGMCIVEAVTGAEPWGAVSDDVVPVLLQAGRLPSRPAGYFRDDQWELVERMCAKDPARRLGLSLVIKKLRVFAALEQDARVALQREAPRVLYAAS